jgi:hypothetical protein
MVCTFSSMLCFLFSGNYEELNKLCWGGKSLPTMVLSSKGFHMAMDRGVLMSRWVYTAVKVSRHLCISSS